MISAFSSGLSLRYMSVGRDTGLKLFSGANSESDETSGAALSFGSSELAVDKPDGLAFGLVTSGGFFTMGWVCVA